MRKRCAGFTLLELMAAMLIIVAISSLVVGIYTYVNAKANRTRATAEIGMFSAAISAYAADFGGPPQSEDTNQLSPLKHFVPTSEEYEKASRDLYKALTGDENRNNKVDPAEEKNKKYIKEIDILKLVKWDAGKGEVDYFKDPYNYTYGYSTAALAAEREFKEEIRKNGRAAKREEEPAGFNASGYDLWSTAGSKFREANDPANPTPEEMKNAWMEWIKNW